jgi:hypothetical protein
LPMVTTVGIRNFALRVAEVVVRGPWWVAVVKPALDLKGCDIMIRIMNRINDIRIMIMISDIRIISRFSSAIDQNAYIHSAQP